MYVSVPLNVGAATRVTGSTLRARGKAMAGEDGEHDETTGTTCQRPTMRRGYLRPDVEKRKTGIAVAKKWLDEPRCWARNPCG